MAPPNPDYNSIPAFHAKLARSRRILAVCGAGLSASSGLPTFRGAGGMWRNYKATQLATYHAFWRDPGLVWMFYAYVSCCLPRVHDTGTRPPEKRP
jgi:NAD-dependent SIR2 family protein deacetylase